MYCAIHEGEWLTYSWSILVHEEQEVMKVDTIQLGGVQLIVGFTKKLPKI